MKRRLLYISALILVIAISICALWQFKIFVKEENSEFVFAKVIKDLRVLDRIVVQTKEQTLNFYIEDNLWRLKEADGYYANSVIYKDIFEDIFHAKYYSRLEDGATFEKRVEISFYEGTRQIDNVSIGKRDGSNINSFIKKDKVSSLASGIYNFPDEKFGWFSQPEYKILPSEVDVFLVDGAKKDYNSVVNIVKSYFSYVFFEDVKKESSIDQSLVSFKKEVKIILKNGFILNMKIFLFEDEFWASIDINTTKLPKQEVRSYVEGNKMLYSGWYFKISKDYGKYIFYKL